eukprot:TRINITY_DN37396_c0_g1_i1.p1 TRINITY_DN37396_c0_g1~~TRINITY_DN37396_c0_g1_i1.p1  ORF type:complete len:309 (+),score=26.04 TRINITY_DN37396_c0_g1_i1:43-927(+)
MNNSIQMNDSYPNTGRAIYSESVLAGPLATVPTSGQPLPLPSQSPGPNVIKNMETPPPDLEEETYSCSCASYDGENTLTYVRVGTKFILTLVFFITFGSTDDDDCSKKLSEWLLIGAIMVLVFLLLSIVTAPKLHQIILKTLIPEGQAAQSPSEPSKQEMYVKRIGWGITFVTALWCLVWTIVAITKLRKGSRQLCGTAFTGTAVVVAFNCLSLLLCTLCLVSHMTGTTEPPTRITTPPADPPVSAPVTTGASSLYTSNSAMYSAAPMRSESGGVRTETIRAQANSGFQSVFAP